MFIKAENKHPVNKNKKKEKKNKKNTHVDRCCWLDVQIQFVDDVSFLFKGSDHVLVNRCSDDH